MGVDEGMDFKIRMSSLFCMFRNVWYKIIVKCANNNVLGLLFSLYKIQFKDC